MTTPFVLNPQLTLQVVRDDNGQSLGELCVLFRPGPPPASAKEAGLLDYLSSLAGGGGTPAFTRPYQLGRTDADGYLQPAIDAPVGPLLPSAPVESLKLTEGVAYEMYFLRHPDLEYARTVLAELNGQAAVHRTQGWAAPQSFTPAVARRVNLPEDQLTLRVPATASTFLPAGHSDYGGWVLYKEMPHGDLQAVKDAVKKLQQELGKVGYIVGAEAPYEPERPVTNKGKVTNAATANEGIFDARTMSGVLHLQRQVIAHQAFAIAPASAASPLPHASWAATVGSDTAPNPPAPQANEAAIQADGVFDAITARALSAWRAANLRRRGAIVVAVPALGGGKDWITWLRPEAAESLLAWRAISIAMGHDKGICASHTYRTPLTDVGHAAFGRSAVSIHKTGLAMDLFHNGTDRTTVPAFPVAICRDAVVPKTSNGVHVGDRYYWRLYGATKIPMDAAAATTALQASLTPLVAAGGLKGQVASTLLAALAPPAAGGAASGPAASGAAGFFDTYYRNEVTKWQYDAWDDEGGQPGPAVTAAQHRGDDTFTRFVDLTKLGELCKVQRIGSFTNNVNPTGSDWGLAAKSLKASDNKKLKALGDALATAQENVHDPITVKIGGQNVPLADIHASYFGTYADKLAAIAADAKGKAYATITGSQIKVKLSWAKTAREGIEVIASQLEGLGSEELIATDLDNKVDTAANWAAWLRAELDLLDPAAPSKLTDGTSKSAVKPPQKVTLLPVVARVAGAPAALAPTESILYPSPGDPIGMEWWHFQRTDLVSAVKHFGALLLALGWTNEGLLDVHSPATHGREGVGYPQTELDKTVG